MELTKEFPKKFKEGLIDGDMIAFSSCAALEYGKEPEEVDFRDIQKLIDDRLAYMKRILGIEKMRVFLTSSYNFRYDINPEYKANRVDVWRPFHLANAKAYMKGFHNAEEVHGLEADDLMSIYQDRENNTTVICTLDKDLKQVPGCHFTWETQHHGEKRQVVTPLGCLYYKERGSTKEYKGNGFMFFMHQCLIGDSTDGVLGCATREMVQVKSGKDAGMYKERRIGIGPTASYKLLKDCTTMKDAFQVVAKQYKEVHGNAWKEKFLQQARCVHMLKELPDENGNVYLWYFDTKDKESSAFSLSQKTFLHG